MRNAIIKSSLLIAVVLQFEGKLIAQATNKIDSVGNVGIGTTSPTDKLTVEGQIKSGAILMTGWSNSPYSNSTWLRGASGVGIFMTNENVSRWAGIKADGSFDVSSGKLFVDGASGNVGIGTGATGDRISIKQQLGSNAIGLYDHYDQLRLSIGQELNYYGNYIDSRNIDFKIKSSQVSGTGGTISFWTQNNGTLDAEEKMRINPSGNVGIGTSNPTDKLTVAGQIKSGAILMTGWSQSPYNNSTWLRGASGVGVFMTNESVTRWAGIKADGSFDVSGGKLFVDATSGNVGIGTGSPQASIEVRTDNTKNAVSVYERNGNKAIEIDKYGSVITYTGILSSNSSSTDLVFSTGASEGIRIQNGNVGIGSVSPVEKLSVNGNVRAKKVIVSQTGWPDYVFDPAYKLKPLSELAAFIQKHQHLPDMPSAKEVEEKGVSVGDNQALLLKKIEELTLYVIALQEENERQDLLIKKLLK